MPIFKKKDIKGSYYRFGHHGKKYYYDTTSSKSQKIAYGKALKQNQAIHATKIKFN